MQPMYPEDFDNAPQRPMPNLPMQNNAAKRFALQRALQSFAGGLAAPPQGGFFGGLASGLSGSLGAGMQYDQRQHEQERQRIKDEGDAAQVEESRRRWDATFGQDTNQLNETIRHNKVTETPKPDTNISELEYFLKDPAGYRKFKETGRAAADEGPAIDDASLDSYADGLATTGTFPNLGGFGKYGTKVKLMIGQRAVQRHPGLNLGKAASDYKANTAALSKMTQTRSGLDAFSDTMLSNMNILKTEATSIPEFGNRWMNAGARKAAAVFGDTHVARFNTALETVVPEAARILQSGGSIGGAPLSDQQKKDLKAVLHGDFTLKQLMGSLDVLTMEVNNRKAAQDKQIETLQHKIEPYGQTTTGDVEWIMDANGNLVQKP